MKRSQPEDQPLIYNVNQLYNKSINMSIRENKGSNLIVEGIFNKIGVKHGGSDKLLIQGKNNGNLGEYEAGEICNNGGGKTTARLQQDYSRNLLQNAYVMSAECPQSVRRLRGWNLDKVRKYVNRTLSSQNETLWKIKRGVLL